MKELGEGKVYTQRRGGGRGISGASGWCFLLWEKNFVFPSTEQCAEQTHKSSEST